jgi:hypothetical protein
MAHSTPSIIMHVFICLKKLQQPCDILLKVKCGKPTYKKQKNKNGENFMCCEYVNCKRKIKLHFLQPPSIYTTFVWCGKINNKKTFYSHSTYFYSIFHSCDTHTHYVNAIKKGKILRFAKKSIGWHSSHFSLFLFPLPKMK